jgi:hypothetical protein
VYDLGPTTPTLYASEPHEAVLRLRAADAPLRAGQVGRYPPLREVRSAQGVAMTSEDFDAVMARLDAAREKFEQRPARPRLDPYWLAKGLAEKAGMDYEQLRRDHRATWHVVLGGERIDAKVRHLRGGGWGFDVTCRCGWESRTGGAIRSCVKQYHVDHVADVVLAVLVPPTHEAPR